MTKTSPVHSSVKSAITSPQSLGNTFERTVWARLQLRRRPRRSYSLRAYNTVRGEWYNVDEVSAAALRRDISFEIDRRGFAVVELTPH
jgi:hypothetical protein